MASTTTGERVLIVEDEPSTRLGLTELVRTWGFTADSAGDGEEALRRITVFRPSIIISDLVMLQSVDSRKYSSGTYKDAKQFVKIASERLKERNYTAAAEAADKALKLATDLVGR